MIQADADGKGAMPVLGPVSITDDLSPDGLFPQLTDEQRNRMKTDPDKYGARVSVDPGKFHVSHMPLPSFGFYDPPQPDKSVRDSGVFTAVQPAGPGTPATITIEKTDWSLLTNPKYSETGSPLPEHMAYVVSMCVNVDIPIDTVTDFGTQAAGAATWSLDMHNRYTQMEMRGLDAGSDHATIDSQPTANDSLDRTLRRDIPGGLTVGMGGMPGDARNTPGEKFHKGWANSIPGLPGDAVYRMAENTVMRGQKVTAQLMYGGANSSAPTTVTHLSCAVWDPAQYYLADVNTPGADPGSWYDRPSGGRPIWLSGASPGMATRPIQVWYAGNVEAGAGTPDRNRLSDADCSGVNWVDSPDKVQGNDPALAAQGIYTAVNRVRVFAPIPPPQGIADTVYESVLVGLTVSSQKVPDGSILDFWSSDRQKYMDSSLAEMLETPLPSASGFIADHWGWATLACAHARIDQLVSPASDDSNRVKTLKVTGNDLVHFHITPTLTSPGGPDETTNEVWIEDCLPAGLEYDPAGTTPTDNLTTYPQSPPDAKRACGAGETYMRWIFPGQKVNEPIAGGTIVVQARVSPAAKNGYYANNAYIWASGDRTTDKDLLSSYSLVVIDNPAGVFLDKLNVTPQVQVNRSGSLLTQSNVWRVRLGSTLETQETRLTDSEIIDVLPGRAGDTASHFSGKAVLKSVKVTQGAENGRTVTVEYTKADKVPRTPDWSVPVTWCATLGGTGCPASLDEVTAIRLVRPGILVNGEAIDALISVDLIGDKGGDVVTNTPTAGWAAWAIRLVRSPVRRTWSPPPSATRSGGTSTATGSRMRGSRRPSRWPYG